ncbi:MAG: 50S ribosomal protein L17 [Candidatus Omnitrophota bacterium]
MRHAKRNKRLGRNNSARKALMRSLVSAILKKQRIVTTLSKAKEARRAVAKVITLAKKGDLASQRRIFSILRDRSLVRELVNEIAPRFAKRQGGYTRIIRYPLGRKGDNAPMAVLELTEQKHIEPPKQKSKKQKKEDLAQPQQPVAKEDPAPKPKEAKVPAKEEKPDPAPKPEKAEKPKEEPKPQPRDVKKPFPTEKQKKGLFHGFKRFLRPPKTG